LNASKKNRIWKVREPTDLSEIEKWRWWTGENKTSGHTNVECAGGGFVRWFGRTKRAEIGIEGMTLALGRQQRLSLSLFFGWPRGWGSDRRDRKNRKQKDEIKVSGGYRVGRVRREEAELRRLTKPSRRRREEHSRTSRVGRKWADGGTEIAGRVGAKRTWTEAAERMFWSPSSSSSLRREREQRMKEADKTSERELGKEAEVERTKRVLVRWKGTGRQSFRREEAKEDGWRRRCTATARSTGFCWALGLGHSLEGHSRSNPDLCVPFA
jgi:hypothetical protein